MSRKVAFIGHRNVGYEIEEKLYNEVKKQIEGGCQVFTMGTHGEFDKVALSVCRSLRRNYSNISIEVVLTSLNSIKPIIEYDAIFGNGKYIPYDDVETIMYEIEEQHYKKKIVTSNQRMIDTCDTLVCYVDTSRNSGGAITAYKYAKKKGLKIINLFNDN